MVKVVKKKAVAKKTTKAPVKKLTKAQLHKEQWSPTNIDQATSMVLHASLADARVQFKDLSISTAGEAGGLVLGIPLPSFALEYAFQNTVWPLERVAQVVGIQGTCKSGFTAEVARWFRRRGHGLATVFEVEDKWSPDWAPSIMGWDDPDSLGLMPCSSVNDWQKKLLWMVERCKRAMLGTKKDPGSGRIWPWLGIIDSVTGKATDETQDNIATKGFAGRARPEEARMITGFLRTLPEKLRGWPFAVLAVNHLKPDKDPHTQAIIRNKSGGRGLDFMETWELELSAQPDKRIREPKRDGLRLFLSCKKNSLGVTDRKAPVEVSWWQEEVFDAQIGDVAWRQVTEWDWFGSTISLLLKLPLWPEGKAKAGLLKEIINVVPVSAKQKKSHVDPAGETPEATSSRRVICKALGIGKASPATFKDAGMVLQETPEILHELRKLFGVKARAEFANDVDYRKQRVLEKKRLKARLDSKGKKLEDLSRPQPTQPLPDKRRQHGKLLGGDDDIEREDDGIEKEEDIEVE